jgi:hypothetical protein
MDPPTARPEPRLPEARRDFAETERRWHELSAELDAAEDMLTRLQPPEGALITPEIFEQIEAAKRRRYQVQFAMIDFLDTLDDMPP